MSAPEIRRELVRGPFPLVAAVTYGVATASWVALAERLVPMPGVGVMPGGGAMPSGGAAMDPASPGVPEAMGVSNGLAGVIAYLIMWGVMMVAMMYPSSAGIFQWYADLRGRSTAAGTVDAIAGTVGFVGAYTLLWIAVGLVPLAVNAVAEIQVLAARWGSLYYGVAFLAVGLFQLSPFKRRYLGRCRTPSGFLVERYHDAVPGAVRLGWEFGVQDVGSCGVLMGLMVVVGTMNVGWMVLITAVLSVERLSARGYLWASAAGVLAAVGGVGIVATWVVQSLG